MEGPCVAQDSFLTLQEWGRPTVEPDLRQEHPPTLTAFAENEHLTSLILLYHAVTSKILIVWLDILVVTKELQTSSRFWKVLSVEMFVTWRREVVVKVFPYIRTSILVRMIQKQSSWSSFYSMQTHHCCCRFREVALTHFVSAAPHYHAQHYNVCIFPSRHHRRLHLSQYFWRHSKTRVDLQRARQSS